MTLESITLSEVKARVGTLETDVLQETKTALEEEAEMLAKEQKMGEKTATEDAAVSEETTEAEILTLESLSEATDALEAETSVVLEAMFCSGPGPIVGQEPGHTEAVREKPMGQEAVREFAIGGEEGREREEGSVLEAMSLESVTLAEVEAVLGTLESAALTETTAQLEKEAETLAKDEKMGENGTLSEENTEAEVESLSLPEADGLSEALQAETDVLMEELLFSVPGRVAVVTEDPIGQEVVGEDVLGGNVASETPAGIGEETLERGRGQEEIVVDEALTLESLTLSEVEALVETLEMDELTETETDQPETEAETPVDTEKEAFSEVAEADVLSEAEILTKAEVLAEAADALEAESAVFLHNLLCPVPGLVATTTVATGSGAADLATTDTLSPPAAAPPTEVLGQEEEEEEEGAGSPPAGTREEVETEEGEQTEALGIHEGLDPVQRLFLEKIREYNNKQRLCGGTVEAGPDFEKRLSEEKAKLQRLYGGGDLSSFPQFTFTEPKLDQDSK
ncbi:uro-adherence factor A-like [Centroberyx affinis]|uniref:uro-adherence factor A-like n=1 Tax=Centroberyx affinis TaxID=166261 RepID=UPI003A5BE7AF